MRTVILTLVAAATVGLVAATLVVGLGLYNVSARAGHLPGVSWLLHTTFRNAVHLRAPPESEVPALGGEDMIALGARHFDTACRVCHGAPGETESAARTATAREMVPEPPHVTDAVKNWKPNHLFWIVRNGVKMTGMPAWPARRKDEVWPVVAFLEAVREMSFAEYAALVAPPGDVGEAASTCSVCHGADGRGRGNALVPRLDIQTPEYLAASLRAYRDGARESGVMAHAAARLTDAEIDRLATAFGVPQTTETPDVTLEGRGAALALGPARPGEPPVCASCHGPWPTPLSPLFPRLSGQSEAYLLAQLDLWRSGIRGGGPRSHLMRQVAHAVTEADARALAAFYAARNPE